MAEKLPRPQVRLLMELGRYRWMTCEQLSRVTYTPSYVREHIHKLHKAGYVRRTLLAHHQQNGVVPYWYTLSDTGEGYLKGIGQPPPDGVKRRPIEEHTIGLVDTLIAARKFGESQEASAKGIVVNKIVGEYTLKQSPRLVIFGQEKIGIVPDAYIEMYHNQEVWPLSIEYDRDTERQATWMRKVRGYIALAEEESVIVLVAVASEYDASRRLTELRRWTYRELERLGMLTFAPVFHLTTHEPKVDPVAFFLGSHWYLPDNAAPVALFL